MNTILVATDFSDSAQNALDLAILLARSRQASLLLLHSVAVYPALETVAAPPVFAQNADSYSSAKTSLEQKAAQIREQGIACEIRLETGSVTEVIRQLVEQQLIDLVVVGRTGTGNWFMELIGNHASDLVSALTVPVLMVPPDWPVTEIKQIAYATQLEFDETEVLREVFDLAQSLGASVALVKVNVPFEPNIHPDADYLADIREAFSRESYEVVTRDADTVSEGVVQVAEEVGANLLVLASHHRNLLTQLINPSKSKQVLAKSSLPTLVFPLEAM
ncbi:MAG: universal stress protein [Cytophagaceae bacterium]|nr:universal stress protein [Cytophagaceae bacterium]